MTALQTARAELRDLAMNLVLSDLSYLTRLGCRLVGPLQSMTAQVAAKKGHRKLMRLVHPDKNNGSAKSELATKELQKLLEVAQWIGPLAWHSLQLRPLHPMETAFLAQEALVQRLAEEPASPPSSSYPGRFFDWSGFGLRCERDWWCDQPGSILRASSSGASGTGGGPSNQAGNAAPSAAPEPKAKAEPKAKRGPGRPRKSGPAPQEASAAPASTGKRKAEDLFFTEEPVNRASIEAFMKLRGSRKVILESGYSLFETLGFFLVRAADGYMKVTWRESKIPGDILGRRFSGVDNGMEPPRDSDFFDVPHSHACTSAFAHPRLIKEICRRGLKGWVDVDVVNSVFSQFAANFQECPDVVKRYNRDRDGMIAGVCEAYGCSRDVAKRLFIRLGFMGRVESWLEDFGLKKNEGPLEAELVCFGQDMRRFGEALVAKDAGYFELFKDKKYPLGSFMSAIYFKLERRFLDRMIAAVPEPAEVLSFEHDGLGIKLNGLSETALLEALNFNPMVKVVIKTPHDPLELAREQFPGEEWVGPTAVSGLQFDAAELHRALLVTRRCMQPMKPQK
ncbi:unnamed protein product, partial [Symbiodinium microadriaticum]